MKKKLVWDKTGERLYETGVSQGVLYPIQTGGVYNSGTAWNGLSTVTESPSGAEPTAIYADNIKYLNLMSAEEFGGTIEAYMAPDEFAECDGSKEIALECLQDSRTVRCSAYLTRHFSVTMLIPMITAISFISSMVA